jgi:hypothetical protein
MPRAFAIEVTDSPFPRRARHGKLVFIDHTRPPPDTALSPRSLQPGTSALDDERAFELCEQADHGQKQPSVGRGRVNPGQRAGHALGPCHAHVPDNTESHSEP